MRYQKSPAFDASFAAYQKWQVRPLTNYEQCVYVRKMSTSNGQYMVTYIHQHLQQGYREADIRSHLAANGWSVAAIDQAFRDYYAAVGPSLSSPTVQTAQRTPKRHTPKKRRLLKWALVTTGILALGIIGLIIYLANSPKTLNKMAQPALEQHAENTARANEVSMIMATMNQYVSDNNGVLPQKTGGDNATTLSLCGEVCDETKVTLSLSFYKPQAVLFRPYSSNLAIPSANTIYIVPGAMCNGNQDGLGRQTSESPTAVALLYGAAAGSGVKQKCIVP